MPVGFKILILAVISLALSACASMSAEECQTADWYTVGYEDGARGYSTTAIGRHRKACAKHGVSPKFDRYTAGHAKGLALFCVPRQGFSLGSKGQPYPDLCPAQIYPEVDDAYSIGLRVNDIQLEINALQAEHDNLADEKEDLLARIANNEEMIISDNTEPATRRDLMAQNKELEAIALGLESDLAALDQEIASKKQRRDAIHY